MKDGDARGDAGGGSNWQSAPAASRRRKSNPTPIDRLFIFIFFSVLFDFIDGRARKRATAFSLKKKTKQTKKKAAGHWPTPTSVRPMTNAPSIDRVRRCND